MVEPGPPPYTREQIAALATPEERTRARAELSSYIAWQLRRQEEWLQLEKEQLLYEKEQADRELDELNGYSSHFHSGEPPRRGNYAQGNNRYHPYQRSQPPYAAQKYKNRSVTFGKPQSTTESLGASEVKNVPPKSAYNTSLTQSNRQQIEPKTLCSTFTSTGVCSRPRCRFAHDPNKQALCKRWLYKDDCAKGNFCPLSHTTSPHNSPTCLHFQDGRCTNDDCRFAHIRVNPAAPNCDAFGRLGYCEKGNSCPDLHAHECPSFSNTGVCLSGDDCRLGHIHRASRMRQARRSSPLNRSLSGTPVKELDTAEETQELTVHPETVSDQKPHGFTQQADFVPLEADN